MKRSKKPLTFVAVAASIGALSLGLEACVYGPPPEPAITETVETEEETKATKDEKPSAPSDNDEVVVYGPPSDLVDGPEEDVYGPPPEVEE